MAEGPQVLLRTEWLQRHLGGRKILRCSSSREDIESKRIVGRTVERVFCKGKNIFFDLGSDLYLHNHLLMRGKWKKLSGAQLLLPPGTWVSFDVGPYTLCNIDGQRLRLIGRDELDEQLASLGPDTLQQPYPAEHIRRRLLDSNLAISEALLQQSILAGIGNIAKSEILFQAQIPPDCRMCELSSAEASRLLEAIPTVLWNSHQVGGRWECNVYKRRAKPCVRCGVDIVTVTLRPSKRTTYFCPQCQRGE